MRISSTGVSVRSVTPISPASATMSSMMLEIVGVQRHELDAAVEVLTDGAAGFLEGFLHHQDRRADVHPEAVFLEHVRAAAGPLPLFDDGDIEAHMAEAQRRGQSAHPRADDDNRFQDELLSTTTSAPEAVPTSVPSRWSGPA